MANGQAQVYERDYEWLLTRSRTAYEILSVDKLKREQCTSSVIRKAYRKKALELHPDKNRSANAEVEFREVSVSYMVLSDTELRTRYDDYLGRIEEREQVKHAILGEKERLKKDLLNNEELYRGDQDRKLRRERKLAMLHSEFEQKKREKIEEGLRKQDDRGFGKGSGSTYKLSRKVRVKWKNRPELAGSINEEVIRRLMGVFGEIESVRMSSSNKPNEKYHYSTVVYVSPVSSALACVHDYSKTDSLWDELGIRKLASLLRSAKLQGYEDVELSREEKGGLSFDDYVGLSTMKLADRLLSKGK
ncbi:DEKNAAC103881 [Brettanomyces naardenensis]|uniref:DEKNAAC103881 n=1 Tax=Brettanomyces naardenensis TaxID=13370 RepID=A0A448YPN1_BRENA|nr:DEKNAAC103881 [Brettanomyces naardenensis]